MSLYKIDVISYLNVWKIPLICEGLESYSETVFKLEIQFLL